MTPEQAVRTVAAGIVFNAAEKLAEEGWEDYPEIGEHDWEAVVDAAISLVTPCPPIADMREAYDLLTARAEDNA